MVWSGRGTFVLKSGQSRKKRDRWQPYFKNLGGMGGRVKAQAAKALLIAAGLVGLNKDKLSNILRQAYFL